MNRSIINDRLIFQILITLSLIFWIWFGLPNGGNVFVFIASLFALKLEWTNPSRGKTEIFRNVFLALIISYSSLNVLSIVLSINEPYIDISNRGSDFFYGAVIVTTLGLGLKEERDIYRILEVLIPLLDEIEQNYRVDPERVYVTGLSMGGYGTWQMAFHCPERIAAAAPICGGGKWFFKDRLKDVPIWAFHGANDPVVPLKESEEMVAAVKSAGGTAKLTVYPGVEHNSWDKAYADEELYEWLLSHKWFGPYIRNWREHKAIPLRSKFIILALLWGTLCLTAFAFIDINLVRGALLIIGIGVTIFIMRMKTLTTEMFTDYTN